MIHVAGILTATAFAIGLYFRFVVLAGQPAATGKAIAALILTLVISALFADVSAWAVAIISITPVSGMTLTTLIISSVILGRYFRLTGSEGMLSALLIGGVVCSALAMTGSMITLMKIGYWIGGTPKKSQWALIGGAAVASVTVTAVIPLFAHTQGYVVTPEHPNPMPAPQANAMAAVVRSTMETTEAPWFLYGLGAVIALLVEMTGVSPLAFALGMYLPMELNTPLLAGAIVAWGVRRSAGRDQASRVRMILATRFDVGSGQRTNSVVTPASSITFWYGVPSYFQGKTAPCCKRMIKSCRLLRSHGQILPISFGYSNLSPFL